MKDLESAKWVNRAVEQYGVINEWRCSGLTKKEFIAKTGICRATFYRHLARSKEGAYGLMDNRRNNKGKPKAMCNELTQEALSFLADHPAASIALIHRFLVDTCRKNGWTEDIPSYARVKRLIGSIAKDIRHSLLHGEKSRVEHMALTNRRFTAKPLERYQIDWGIFPVWMFDRTISKELFLPYFISVIDCCTRAMPTIYFCRTVSAKEIMITLKRAILGSGDEYQFAHGLPMAVGMDNGSAFSAEVIAALQRLNITAIPGPTYCPEAQGKVERVTATIKGMAAYLRGFANTFGAKGRAKRAALPVELWNPLAQEFLLKYHLQNHEGLHEQFGREMTPWDCWHRLAREAHGLIYDPTEVDMALRLSEERKVQPSGVKVARLWFIHPTLEGMVDETVTVLVPPDKVDAHTKIPAFYKNKHLGDLQCHGGTELADQIREGRLARTEEIREYRRTQIALSKELHPRPGVEKPIGPEDAVGATEDTPLPGEPTPKATPRPKPSIGEIPDFPVQEE